MATSSLHQMGPALISRSKTLINKDLQRVCKAEGQPISGVKAQLQQRVTDLINRAVHNQDHALFNRLQTLIAGHPAPSPVGSYSSRPSSTNSPQVTQGRAGMANGYQQPVSYNSYQQVSQPRTQFMFKESPFYTMHELLLGNMTLEASPSHRQNATKNLVLESNVCARLRADSMMRVLLFCAAEQPTAPFSRVDVSFPSQIEVRINNDEVKANYKGLKNKPGSTRPVDVTHLVRTNPANYRNTVLITYALTQKASAQEKFNVFFYLAQKNSVEELSQRIQKRNVITKHSVLSEMRKKANDPDIVVESSVMSLKDPISTMRIKIPCRSTICTHNRCFDCENFLMLQEQAPTWTCPICNKTISFDALAVDEYVQEILDTVPAGTDQVTIEPNGQWSKEKDKANNRQSNGYNYRDPNDSEEDLVEVPDYRVATIKSEAVPTPQSLARTPPAMSREASSAPRTGSKRTSEVIDLTLSDDDEPPRPTKKVAYSTPNSLSDAARQYQMPYLPTHRPDNMRMNPPPQDPSRHSYGGYTSQNPTGYSGQGTSTYPTYIGSSP